MKIVNVGLDVPIAKTFDYLAPGVNDEDIGERVIVPFGARRLIGIVLGIAEHSSIPSERLKPIVRVLRGTRLTDDDLRLLRFASEYYHYPLGQVAITALPKRLKRIDASPGVAQREYALTTIGAAVPLSEIPARAAVRRKLLQAFQS